ncbi:MAG: Gfo/Idh/MocA family oxidoreductase [Dehalococcoidia bacterium]|nr:Gfo/Idh/MocA family oxidoreductase [Dehalococcoidia bacterium]
MRPRIGIIGAGVMGTTHGKSIHFCLKHGLVDGELIGLAEADPERRDSYAAAAGLSFVTDDPYELIAHPGINTVYICTPTAYHRELALAVCAAGKALFCEKPLAFNAGDASSMRDAAAAAGITHQVGLVMRFSPVVTVTRELLRDASMGRPMTAVMVDDQYFPIQGHYRSTWRGDVNLVGAGTLLEHAIHDVDILVSYFGRLRRVYGVTRHFFGKEGVEDLSSATLEFASGAVVSHTSIWHNLLHRGSSRRMLVVCEDGQLQWQDNDWAAPIDIDANAAAEKQEISSADVIERHIELAGLGDERLRASVRAEYAGQDYLLEDYAFLRAVSDGREAWPGFDVAVYAHEVVDAIYRSAREGRAVEMA